MRTLRYIVLALLFLILVAVVVGFFLPSKVHLERSIEINRDKATIFKVINAYKNFNKWSPWYDLDVNAKYTVSGPNSGIGSKLEWHGNEKVGDGTNEIIESVENDYIKSKMFFGKSDAPAYSIISLKDNGGKTTVTWAFENDFGMNVFYRYFGLVIEDMIAPDYERGLKKLKTYVEELPLYDYSNISTVTSKAEHLYTIEAKTGMKSNEITQIIGTAYGDVIAFINKNNLEINGSPKIINLSFGDNIFHFLAGIPVVENTLTDEAGIVKSGEIRAVKALKYIHKGSYTEFKKTYTILNAYIAQNNLQRAGNSWEDYVTDPGSTPVKDLITHIYQPIK